MISRPRRPYVKQPSPLQRIHPLVHRLPSSKSVDRIPESAIRILAEHPNAAVRLATLDAVAFAGDDDPAILDRLRELAREEDRALVGVPRRTSRDREDSDGDRDATLERIAAFQERIDAAPEDPQPDAKEI